MAQRMGYFCKMLQAWMRTPLTSILQSNGHVGFPQISRGTCPWMVEGVDASTSTTVTFCHTKTFPFPTQLLM